MARIVDYDSLHTAIARFLNRTDLVSDIPTFIQLGEQKLRRDHRARGLNTVNSFVVEDATIEMPVDFESVQTWRLDGPTYFHKLDTVTANELSILGGQVGGVARVPRAVSFAVAGSDPVVATVAPSPDASYDTKLTYWRRLPDLTEDEPINWLLLDAPDLYLYSALVQSAPFLKDDARIEVWGLLLNEGLDDYHNRMQRTLYSGALRSHYGQDVIGG